MSFKLNIPNTYRDTDTKGDYLSVPVEDLDKTFTEVIDEIPVDETGAIGLTTPERAVLTAFFTQPVHEVGRDEQDNPILDYMCTKQNGVDEDGNPIWELYIPTIQEFAMAMQNTLGTMYHKVGDETKKFIVIELPPLEDSLVIGAGLNEREVVKLFGRGKDRPNYTLFRWIQSNERKSLIEPVPSEI